MEQCQELLLGFGGHELAAGYHRKKTFRHSGKNE
ncbi:MAG: hypothetical protein ACLTNY_06850 [Blautia massiliensis (ex Durand et al. 2017)]